MKTYKIPVITIVYDNGDGGYSVECYNNEDDLIKNHRSSNEMTLELRNKILTGYDEYMLGYIDRSVITIQIVDEKAILVEPLSFHAGQ